MKFYLGMLATTMVVGLTGGLLHAQAPYNCGPQGADGCGQCGQCGQGGQVYLIVAPRQGLFDSSCRYLFGGNGNHGYRSNENCGCCEPQCSPPRCSEPCRQPYHAQPCYAQAPCNEGHCNEGHCNEGHCNRPWSMCIPVKVVSCAPATQNCGYQYQNCGCQYQSCGNQYQGCGCQYQGCGNQYQSCGNRIQPQSCGHQAPCYSNQGNYGQPYGPGGALPGGPVTTAEPPPAEGSAYVSLIQAIQAAQDKDNRALREMMENRQATQAVIRAIQSSDANTVSTFEKMLQQMKGGSGSAPEQIHAPGSSQAPAHMPGAKDSSLATEGESATLSQLRQVSQDLSEMSKKIAGASAEVVTKDNSK